MEKVKEKKIKFFLILMKKIWKNQKNIHLLENILMTKQLNILLILKIFDVEEIKNFLSFNSNQYMIKKFLKQKQIKIKFYFFKLMKM